MELPYHRMTLLLSPIVFFLEEIVLIHYLIQSIYIKTILSLLPNPKGNDTSYFQSL